MKLIGGSTLPLRSILLQYAHASSWTVCSDTELPPSLRVGVSVLVGDGGAAVRSASVTNYARVCCRRTAKHQTNRRQTGRRRQVNASEKAVLRLTSNPMHAEVLVITDTGREDNQVVCSADLPLNNKQTNDYEVVFDKMSQSVEQVLVVMSIEQGVICIRWMSIKSLVFVDVPFNMVALYPQSWISKIAQPIHLFSPKLIENDMSIAFKMAASSITNFEKSLPCRHRFTANIDVLIPQCATEAVSTEPRGKLL